MSSTYRRYLPPSFMVSFSIKWDFMMVVNVSEKDLTRSSICYPNTRLKKDYYRVANVIDTLVLSGVLELKMD